MRRDLRAFQQLDERDNFFIAFHLPSDNGTLQGVTEIQGNPLVKLTLVAPNLANSWKLDAPNSGTLTAGNLQPIAFTHVDTIIGGAGDDRVVVVDGATGLALFDGEGGFDSVVDQAGAPGTTFSDIENFIDRPLLFVPGFAGSFADTSLPGVTSRPSSVSRNFW